MNRLEVLSLQKIKSTPCLTITMPTHRTAPGNKQDPIRLRNLVKQAGERLAAEYGKRETQAVSSQLDELVKQIDHQGALDGLALFVNAEMARSHRLPFTLKERVVLDDSFYTRDLVYALNRTPRYWALALSEKPTRLFEGSRDSLVEVRESGFPMVHEGPGGEAPLPGGYGVRKSVVRDEYERKFFRAVDSALKDVLAGDPLPVVVAGVDRHLAFFNEVTAHQGAVIGALSGSHDKTSAADLAKLVWPLVRENLDEHRTKMLGELEKAVGERKVVSTAGEVWRDAADGRGRVLLVERNFHYPARLDDSGRHLTPAEDPTGADVLDDAVDDIIENVLAAKGEVVFVEDGQLKAHRRIALILRY